MRFSAWDFRFVPISFVKRDSPKEGKKKKEKNIKRVISKHNYLGIIPRGRGISYVRPSSKGASFEPPVEGKFGFWVFEEKQNHLSVKLACFETPVHSLCVACFFPQDHFLVFLYSLLRKKKQQLYCIVSNLWKWLLGVHLKTLMKSASFRP